MSHRIKRRSEDFLHQRARRPFRGFPVATVAFYGPDNQRASKVAIAIMVDQEQGPIALERWFSDDHDVRADHAIGEAIRKSIGGHKVKTVTMTDGIISCPHEEGVDYPEGEKCPQCPFWTNRNRWTGELLTAEDQ